MLTHGKVSCLMATHGRHGCVQRAIACFLAQDYPARELVILNNHPVPLALADSVGLPTLEEHRHGHSGNDGWGIRYDVRGQPGGFIRIINEPIHPTLGHCRNRLIDFADGEYCRTFDDDDLYAPWCISQGVARISTAQAWKPKRSWWCNGPDQFALAANAMEASITFRTHFVCRFGYHLGEGDEHKLLLAALGNAGPANDDIAEWAGYCYRWGCGEHHASGTIGNGQPDDIRATAWKAANNDARPGVPLVPDFAAVRECWRRLVRCLPANLQSPWMAAALGVGRAHAPPVAPLVKDRRRIEEANRLVAAPGCWDVLHPGHVAMLEWARQQGDALIVLVNDDAGVASQKGEGRPLVPLAGRVAALGSLACVDGVCVVEGAADLPWLNILKPAVLAKGPDYRDREASVPCPPGCEVRVMPTTTFAGHTSDLVVS